MAATAAMTALLFLGILHMAISGGAVSPPRGSVSIVGTPTFFGDGCPAGSAVAVVSPDAQTVTVIFSKYSAFTPGALSNRRRSCTVTADIKFPSGFTYSLATVTFRGFAQLESGVVGTLAASYYYSGVTGTISTLRTLPAKFNDNFEFTDKFATLAYAPCGMRRNLNLKSEVRVVPPRWPRGRKGIISVDSQDLKLSQIFRLVWKRC
eukprot:TRINITY_DN381_c0_g2_i4.p2 TRINITY_DN381_c0_g2~~TRINITY_DN381_c0_g2_i4.p2  ORF type:complete len:207 (+),score=33.05 TRINITY_DN381_c0_g2_i4:172-792(+)